MRHFHSYYVYIITNKHRTTFYVGVTNDIERRMAEHRQGTVSGFTRQYHLKHLVFLEETSDVHGALTREKQLKRWHRQWKLNLILSVNPGMKDLADHWYDGDAETSSA